MEQLTKGKNIQASNVSVSVPKHLDNGAKLVYVNYDNARFNIQTPWMDMPWNMSCFSEGPYPKYSMELSFRGLEESTDLEQFLKKLNDVDNRLIDLGVENSVPWFKKKSISRETAENLYNPIVRVSKDKETGEADGKWPSSIRLKVPNRDGKWSPAFKDGNTGEVFRVNDAESSDNVENILVKHSKVRAIIQCVGLWIASGNYMCQWQLVKAEVKVPQTASTCDFIPDSDDELDESGGNNLEMIESSEEDAHLDGEDGDAVDVVVPKKSLKVKKKPTKN